MTEFFGVGRFAAKGEKSTSMPVCWLDVLVATFVAGKLGLIGAQLKGWSVAV